MKMQAAIEQVVQGQDLSREQMQAVMRTIMTGGATDAQIGGFLIAERMKGETVAEITAAAEVMRELASGVNLADLDHAIDIVGTGGDARQTFNISTTSMFVAAAAGCKVAKHGNRSVSSRSGSADVLEAAGIRLHLSADQVAQCVRQIGLGFMFAPGHHTAMKHAIGPRKEMGVRTLFNVLGPLTNPAKVKRQLLGVFDESLLMPMAQVLQNLGAEQVMVVHSQDGLDEISIAAPTEVAELKENRICRYRIEPQQFGLQPASLDHIQVENAAQSLAMMQAVLNNQEGPAKDIVLLNAGAAIYIAGLAPDMAAGIDRARQAIASGAAAQKMQDLVQLTQELAA